MLGKLIAKFAKAKLENYILRNNVKSSIEELD